LREAVGVVVWDVADLEDMVVSGQIERERGIGSYYYVWTDLAPGPFLAFT
jgi:hypothetical protein